MFFTHTHMTPGRTSIVLAPNPRVRIYMLCARRALWQIIFLALPGVILGAGLTAVFVKLILRFDWSWSLCMVFGSMVAATDPVAVVALLEELVSFFLLLFFFFCGGWIC